MPYPRSREYRQRAWHTITQAPKGFFAIIGLLVFFSIFNFMGIGIQQLCRQIPIIGAFAETVASLASFLFLLLIFPFFALPFSLALRFQREKALHFREEVDFIVAHYFKIVRLFIGIMLTVGLFFLPLILIILASMYCLSWGEKPTGLLFAAIFFLALISFIPYMIFSIRLGCILFFFRDNAQAGVFAIIKKNWFTLRGHTWRLFKLDLSFIGWALLLVLLSIPFSFVATQGFQPPSPENGTNSPLLLVQFIPMFLMAPLNAWILLANSAFYDDLTGKTELE